MKRPQAGLPCLKMLPAFSSDYDRCGDASFLGLTM